MTNQNIQKAIWSMFPSKKDFEQFKYDERISPPVLPKIIDLAYRQGLIDEPEEERLIDLIENNQTTFRDNRRQAVTFDDFLEELNIKSDRQLISEMNKVAKKLGFPKISSPTITRLKQKYIINTPLKRAVIRILAFWTGMNRPTLNYHYRHLLKLSPAKRQSVSVESRGVVVRIEIQTRGDLLEKEAVEWIRDETVQCFKDQNISYERSLQNELVKTGPTSYMFRRMRDSGDVDSYQSYASAILEALTVSHQMVTRWALSEYHNNNNKLVIAIAAGSLSEAEAISNQILNANIITNDQVFLNSAAYIYAKGCYARVGLTCHENVITHDLQSMTVWSVKHYWHRQYDVVDNLLEKNILPQNREELDEFRQELHFPEKYSRFSYKAISHIKNSANSFSLIEISKVLIYRKMFQEALDILSTLLVINPNFAPAKLLKSVCYLNLALRSDSLFQSEILFDMVISELQYILDYCPESEEPGMMSEMGIAHWAKGLQRFFFHRRGVGNDRDAIMRSIDAAKKYFHAGIGLSPDISEGRNIFWLMHSMIFKHLLEQDDNLFNGKYPLEDNLGSYYRVGGGIVRSFILAPEEKVLGSSLEYMLDRLTKFLSSQHTVQNNRTVTPARLIALSTIIHDINPNPTVGSYKTVLNWLNTAIKKIEMVEEKQLGVFGFSMTFSNILDAPTAVATVKKLLNKIHLPITLDGVDYQQPLIELLPDKKYKEKYLKRKIMLMAMESDFDNMLGKNRKLTL